MMHQKTRRKLGRTTPHRKAMLANMCSSLILNKKIETTLTRAKEIRRLADRMITLGKRGTVHARRQALKVLRNNRAVRVVFNDLAPTFTDRMGGYTRILKLGYRRGDSAPMAIIEYLAKDQKVQVTEPKKPPKKAAKKETKKKEEKVAAKKESEEKKTEKKASSKKTEKKAKTTKKASAKSETKKKAAKKSK